MEQLRQTMLSEAEMLNSKKRFGLFSQPTPLTLGDNSVFNSKTGSFHLTQQGKEKMVSLSRCHETCCRAPTNPEWLVRTLFRPAVVSMWGTNIWIPRKWTFSTTKNSTQKRLSTNSNSNHPVARRHRKEINYKRFGTSYKHIDENPT